MDGIDTLYENPCFGKCSTGRNVNRHHDEFTPDVLLQNLSKKLGYKNNNNNERVDLKEEYNDDLVVDAGDMFKRHPRYFTEEYNSSNMISNTMTPSVISEKYNSEKIAKPWNKCKIEIVDRPEILNTGDDIMDTKLNCFLLKISSLLKEINTRICTGIQPIESEDDSIRRKKRVTEFFSRFTRNYLYQLARQSRETRKLLMRPAGSTLKSVRDSGIKFTIHDKLTSMCHTVLQALQAYHHHIPCTVPLPVHTKCLTLSIYLADMCKLLKTTFSSHQVTVSYVEDIEHHCQSLVRVINESSLLQASAPAAIKQDIGKGTRVSLVTGNHKSYLSSTANSNNNAAAAVAATTIPFYKRQTLEKRLSMYNSTCHMQRRNITALAKQKFNVPSRYKVMAPVHCEGRTNLISNKSVVTKQGPDSRKSPTSSGNDKPALTVEKRSNHIQRSHTSSHMHMDGDDAELQTMVEMELRKERLGKQSQQRIVDNRGHKESIVREQTVADKRWTSNEQIVTNEENLRTILQFLLLQLDTEQQQQQRQHTAMSSITEESAMVVKVNNDNNCDSSKLYDKLQGLLLNQVHGIKEQQSSSTLEVTENINENNVQQTKTQSITVIAGAPNAKLICIKDKSCFEPDRTTGQYSHGNHRDKINHHTTNDEHQLEINVTTCIPHRPGRGNTFLQQSASHMKESTTTTTTTWTDTNQISEDFVNKIVESVCADFQLDGVVEQMFKSEFT